MTESWPDRIIFIVPAQGVHMQVRAVDSSPLAVSKRLAISANLLADEAVVQPQNDRIMAGQNHFYCARTGSSHASSCHGLGPARSVGMILSGHDSVIPAPRKRGKFY